MPDARREELVERVTDLVRSRHGGDFRAAFADYDADRDGRLTRGELLELLADAGVGNRFTRHAWALGAIGALDLNADGGVGWDEFEAAVNGGG